jgi:hypothetical protein
MTGECSYEFWEHGQSGEVYAIRLDPQGRITGCRGPLLSDQIHTDQLPHYPYDSDPTDLTWIDQTRENWAPLELQSPPHY